MWTLDENESCEETHATFRLAGADLVPDAIERATGLTADFTAAKGETRPSGTRSVAQPIGVWTLTSKGRIESTSVERHIVYLLERLEPVKDELLAISREQGLDADFFCY